MPGNFHTVPESVTKTWPKPNYVDPVRRGWLPAFSCVLLGVSTLLVAGRFYLRARREAGDFGLDDLFIGLGWLFSIGLSTEAVIDADWYGIDVHTWDVRFDQYVGAALTGWISQILFIASTSATKTSVLLFYRRMAKDTYSRRWLYAIWIALACNAAFFIAQTVVMCLICQPLSAYWESYDFSYDKPYTCLDGNILTPVSGVLGVVSDVYAVLLPCLMLRHYDLDVPRRQKIVLNIIFALGFIVAGCGIARTYYLWEINHTYDTSWAGFNLFVWALLECHLAIIIACAPSLRAFLRRYLGEAFNRTFRSGSYNRSKNSGNNRSQNASTLRSSTLYADPEIGKAITTTEQQVIEKPSDEAMDLHTTAWSGGSGGARSSFTITNPEEYEAYNMRQLSKHRFRRRDTHEDLAHDYNDPKRTHDVTNAVSSSISAEYSYSYSY